MTADQLLDGFPIEDRDVRKHLACELALALDDAYKRGYQDGEESRIKRFWQNHTGKFFAALAVIMTLCAAGMGALLL